MAIRKWILDLSCLIFLMIDRLVSAMEMRPSSDATTPGRAMFVLGDSSVDCGDNAPMLLGFIHRNLSQFPCNGSDTTLLPQLLAKRMGLPYAVPFYSQNGSIPGFLAGVNFGSSAATILYPGSRSYQSLNQQLRQAFETIQLLQLHLGEDPANTFIQTSIFYLSFGKDDFIDYFLNASSGPGLTSSGRNLAGILVHQMTNAVRSLYASNARKIVCAGVLPLGCTPQMTMKRERLLRGCAEGVNRLVLEYNRRMEESIGAINAELEGAHVVFCDIYRAVMEFINNPKAYGIRDVKNACCGGGKYGGCVSLEKACREASRNVWWDLYNPSPAINSLLADSAWSGHPLSSICRPITLQELLFSSL